MREGNRGNSRESGRRHYSPENRPGGGFGLAGRSPLARFYETQAQDFKEELLVEVRESEVPGVIPCDYSLNGGGRS